MKNIRKQIEKGYADLRRSEKLAADYILDHIEQIPDLSIDRLADNAGVSQPTVLRMLKSLGFSGYRDFCYQLVGELAQKEKVPEECQVDRYLRRGKFRSNGSGSSDKTSLPGTAMQAFQ